MRTRRLVTLLLTTLLLGLTGTGALAAPPGDAGSPIVGDALYADGRLYGTVLLGSLPFNDNPQAFDKLFMVPGQPAVAEAAPGKGYNGGRWLPVDVTWNEAPRLLTSYADVMAAAYDGAITLGTPRYEDAFLCPLIPQR